MFGAAEARLLFPNNRRSRGAAFGKHLRANFTHLRASGWSLLGPHHVAAGKKVTGGRLGGGGIKHGGALEWGAGVYDISGMRGASVIHIFLNDFFRRWK